MRILALDLSTSTGFAELETIGTAEPVLLSCGTLKLEKSSILEYGPYPWSYLRAADEISLKVAELVSRLLLFRHLDAIIIEEINLGKNRYSQRALEWIHCRVLQRISALPVYYVSSSEWRHNLGLSMSKEDKRSNRKLSEAKVKAEIQARQLAQKQAVFGKEREALEKQLKAKALADSKKLLGVKGRVNKKHLALRYVNERYHLKLKVKDDDMADAICIGLAYLNKAHTCDGV
jgi:hypothetical protein